MERTSDREMDNFIEYHKNLRDERMAFDVLLEVADPAKIRELLTELKKLRMGEEDAEDYTW